METTELSYPVFEANQVLSYAHLNDMFEYLDEQSRLTRADLIGIGIVCGLDVRFDPPGTVHLSRGCGVTSQGYLIVEPDDLALTHVRSYRLPIEVGYQPFMMPGAEPPQQFDLWELFPDDDEPGAMALGTSGIPLADKAVVLFLELRHDRTRVCSPNDCDDRGGAMTTTVRRLLVNVADLDRLNALDPANAPGAFGGDVTARLGLPDLRMPRFDVPNTRPVTAESVLAGFQLAFRRNRLVASTAEALRALYAAFRPLVAAEFPDDPFAPFQNRFGFLDAVPLTTGQVLFLQYYWDFFDDLLAAYDELRWKGVELVCACCPPDWIFPRHLTAGVLRPDLHPASDYRHRFVPSPALDDCAPRVRAVRTLFRRLVSMMRDFTEGAPDKGVRLTPSPMRAALSQKAVPYYYLSSVSPRLHEVWDPIKTERGRVNQNLGYRSDEYSPPAPVFVTEPLRFDLEPTDFLRIEGHLGRDVHAVLAALLAERSRSRLPFEVVALRTGAFDESIEVDLSKERCRFEDLDTLYAALVSELKCFLVKEVEYFYDIPLAQDDDDAPTRSPKLSLLRKNAPNFFTTPGTVGSRIEGLLAWEPGRELPFTIAVGGVPDLQSQALRLVSALSDLEGVVTDDIRTLDFEAMRGRYAAIVQIAKEMEGARRENVFNPVALQGRLDDIVFRCRLEPFEALEREYRRRILEVKQAQFLSHFLERHPGIQHKAGVPLGGTFILVYHEEPPRKRPDRRLVLDVAAERARLVENVADRIDRLDLVADLGPEATADVARGVRAPTTRIRTNVESAGRRIEDAAPDPARIDNLAALVDRIVGNASLAADPDVQRLSREWLGLAPALSAVRPKGEGRVYREAVAGLADGTVIADFFLPYGCHSDCSPIQYQLPPTRLKVGAGKSCTNSDGFAEVKLTVEGANGALSARIDDGAFEETDGTLLLGVGEHAIVVRDASGNESSPVEIHIPPQLVISATDVAVDQAAGTFQAFATIEGGTPPYLVDPGLGTIVDGTFTSGTLKTSETLSLVVTDSAGCRVETEVVSGETPCELPCEGSAVRQGHRFWLPEPKPRFPIKELVIEVNRFEIRASDGTHDVTAEVAEAAKNWTDSINAADFATVVGRWLREIAKIVAASVGSRQWFELEYLAPTEGGDTGTLRIERLACVEYLIDIVVTFLPGGREGTRRLHLVYHPDGTDFFDERADIQFQIPAFDIATGNKCRPEPGWVEQCEGTDLELDFKFVRVDGETQFEFHAGFTSGGDVPRVLVWEVQDAAPAVTAGDVALVRFEPFEPVEKHVLLTAYTEKGCTVTLERVIDITQPEG